MHFLSESDLIFNFIFPAEDPIEYWRHSLITPQEFWLLYCFLLAVHSINMFSKVKLRVTDDFWFQVFFLFFPLLVDLECVPEMKTVADMSNSISSLPWMNYYLVPIYLNFIWNFSNHLLFVCNSFLTCNWKEQKWFSA